MFKITLKKVLLGLAAICFILYLNSLFSNNSAYRKAHGIPLKNISKNFFSKDCKEYKKNCLDLISNLRYPREGSIHRPPLKEIPKELLKEFEQDGFMPINEKAYYFNDMFLDADSDDKSHKKPIDVNGFNRWRNKVKTFFLDLD